MEPKLRKLLFYVRSIGEYTDFLTTAKLLVHDYNIVMVNEISVEEQGQGYLRRKAEQIGCECYDLSHEIKASGKVKLFGMLVKNYTITFPLTLYVLLSSLVRLRIGGVRMLRKAYRTIVLKSLLDQLITKVSPCAVILNNVNGGTLGELAIACARNAGVKSILMPYTFISPGAPARVYMEHPGHLVIGLKLRLAQKFFPEWLYVYKGHHLLKKRALFEILTLKLLHASPPMPWVQDSSTADVMVVESKFMKEHYQSLGIKHKNMQVVGKPNHDYLHSLYLNKADFADEIHTELEFAQKKPFLLLAIPPRFIGFKEKEGRASEFSDYEEIVSFLLDAASRIKNFNVLLCLHPRERARITEKVFKKDLLPGHMKYSIRDTAELMSVSELYIMAGSSTALWALALKQPVIDYDVYAFQFDFFAGNPDVMMVSKQKEFLELLVQVDNDSDFLKHKKAQLDEKDDYYGHLDGKSVGRIKELINNLTTVHKC